MSRKLSRWRWLKRAFFACLFLLLLLVSIAYYKLPPLAESAIREAIRSENFLSRKFSVTKVGPTETILESVDIASPGWRLETPKVTTTYTWQGVQNARLSEVAISQGKLTLDFDAEPSQTETPKEASPPKKPSSGPSSIFPFDQLQARDLTLVLLRGGKEMRLQGTVSLMDGQSKEEVPWRFDLSQEKQRFRGKGTLNAARQPESISLRSSNPEIEAWLAFLGIDASRMEGIVLDETDIQLNRANSKSDWAASVRVLGGVVNQSSFHAELGEIELSTTIDTEKRFVARGTAQILGIEAGMAQLSALESSFEFTEAGLGSLQLEDRPVLTLGEQVAIPLKGKLAFTGDGTWNAELQSEFDQTPIPGWTVDDFELRAASAEDGSFAFSIPKLGVDMVTLEEISGEWSGDTVNLTASHFIDYGQGEIYGPVPVGLAGVLEDDEWRLQVEAKTLPDQPWQAYWKGLGFSLQGAVRADWRTHETSVALSADLSSADLRRNESAVVLEALKLQGSYETSEEALDMQLRGESDGQGFTGKLASAMDGETRRFNYQVSKLRLPENTILGAFAEALKEMPMSAFLDGVGEVVLPPEAEKGEHRLRLKLARGIYRHPERQLSGQGISGTFAIESFSPFITVDDQRATFGRWRMGDLELTEGTFLYKLGPQGAVLIKEAEARGIGGRLTMKSLSSHPGDPDFESVVTFDKIDLTELSKIIPAFEGKVGGQVSGQVHLRFRDGILSLPLGSLVLNEGSNAYLRMDAKEVLGAQLNEMVEDPTALEIVEAALKDLVVEALTIGFFDPENEDSVCRIQIKGHSREEVPIPNTQGKGKAIAPIHLNINVDDPSEIVRRLLNFGLRKQLNTRLKPGG